MDECFFCWVQVIMTHLHHWNPFRCYEFRIFICFRFNVTHWCNICFCCCCCFIFVYVLFRALFVAVVNSKYIKNFDHISERVNGRTNGTEKERKSVVCNVRRVRRNILFFPNPNECNVHNFHMQKLLVEENFTTWHSGHVFVWLRWGANVIYNVICLLFNLLFISCVCVWAGRGVVCFGFFPRVLFACLFAPSFVLINLFVEINEIDSQHTKLDYCVWFWSRVNMAMFRVQRKFNKWSMMMRARAWEGKGREKSTEKLW